MRREMEISNVLMKSCVWLVLLTSAVHSQNCPSGYRFSTQPPTKLNCDPVGNFFSLQCATMSTADTVTWYWTQNVCEAGINGTAILPGDTSDNYQLTSFATNNRQIGFTVSESILGYYWCEISNAVNVSLRPSTITPVLQPTMSLPACTNALVILSHNANPECAEEDSPTVHSRPPLPSSCVPVISMTTPIHSTSSAHFPVSSPEILSPTNSQKCAEETPPTAHTHPPLLSSCVPQLLTSSFSTSPSSLVPSVASPPGLQTATPVPPILTTVSLSSTSSLVPSATTSLDSTSTNKTAILIPRTMTTESLLSPSSTVPSIASFAGLQTLLDPTSISNTSVPATPLFTVSLSSPSSTVKTTAGLQTSLDSTSKSKTPILIHHTLSTVSFSNPSSLVPSVTSSAGLQTLLDTTTTSFSVSHTFTTASLSSLTSVDPSLTTSAGLQSSLDSTSTYKTPILIHHTHSTLSLSSPSSLDLSVASSTGLQNLLDTKTAILIPHTLSTSSHSILPSVTSFAGQQTSLDSIPTSKMTILIPRTSTAAFLSRPSPVLPSVTSTEGLQTLLDSTSTSMVTVSVPPTTSSGLPMTTFIVISVAVFNGVTALGLMLILVTLLYFRRPVRKAPTRSTMGTLQSTSNSEANIGNGTHPTIPRTENLSNKHYHRQLLHV